MVTSRPPRSRGPSRRPCQPRQRLSPVPAAIESPMTQIRSDIRWSLGSGWMERMPLGMPDP